MLAEEGLIGLGFEASHARRTMEPLRSQHNLRTKLKGHGSSETATRIKQQILSDYRTYKGHFRALCKRCDEALRAISEAFDH